MQLFFYTLLLAGCAAPQSYKLMPTPILYVDTSLDPFAHLSDEHKTQRPHVYYATNRIVKGSAGNLSYSNEIDTNIHFGKAIIRMGEPGFSWDDIRRSSLSAVGSEAIPLYLEQIHKNGSIQQSTDLDLLDPQKKLKQFFNDINAELSRSVDKEIMLYVHGTKVNFANATILATEVEHFGGRDFVSLAFSWPSHQNILSYFLGVDVKRALESSEALTNVVALLAKNTIATKINILSYSAGGKVTSKALHELRNTYPDLDSKQLKEKFKIGSVVYACADVGIDVFLGRLTASSELADQVIITISDSDDVLEAAKRFMGGTDRTGTAKAEPLETAYITEKGFENVTIIDVSIGQEIRGFDISGHHYWYRHPWVSSDIIFLMRTDLPPHRRGLQASEYDDVWYLSPDYPQSVQEAVRTELGSQW
ncbi:MAG: esterase/lipase superfamily enzyme [Desulforhopalus sp.]|jgi:esterase/lipase superfamily enzyme